jgi:hypothetical protein
MFLTKAKRRGFKNVLLGKMLIPKVHKCYDEVSEEGKRKSEIFKLNEITYAELILFIDVKTSDARIAFNLVKGLNSV